MIVNICCHYLIIYICLCFTNKTLFATEKKKNSLFIKQELIKLLHMSNLTARAIGYRPWKTIFQGDSQTGTRI